MPSWVVEQEVDNPPLVWGLAPELTFSILSFVDGKALSSFIEALLASKRGSLVGSLVQYVTKRWHDEIYRLLSNHASSPQPALLSFVKENMTPKADSPLVADDYAVMIRNFSEWCILLDYVLQGPRCASSLASPKRMIWLVGVGVFTTTTRGNVPLRSKVVLHCPVWNPTAVILCNDVWLSSHQSHEGLVGAPTNFSWLPSEGDIDGFLADENIGILTPYDDTDVRTFQGTQALTRDDDFLPGMGRPDSCLSILPSVDCPIYGSLVEHMVQSASRNSWMLDEQRLRQMQNHLSMLCFFDSHPKYSGAVDLNGNQPSLENRIIHLMKTCERVIRR